ncbi:MAG TPA: VWA domain-containing protein [Terriglobales bacterium]|nr:VWA domain-containing protein [Terriglobales bacterium]
MPKPWRRLATLLVFLSAALLRSQQVPTFSTSVKVVNVLATVREKKGPIVRNLSKDDFLLEEDGRPQTVRYFAQETNLPLTLGLLVDTSLSQRRVLDQERSASYSFLDHMLREDKDLAFVIHFDREVELLQDLTSSRQKLESSLTQLQTPEPMRRNTSAGGSWPPGPGPSSGPVPGSGRRGAGTLLYDAVYLASDELMQKQEGRKAYIILSDGVDMGSKLPLERAIEAAQRANTVVYGILFSDEQAYSNLGGFGGHMGGMGRHGGGYPRYPQVQHPDGKKVLERISRETGGRMFEVSKKLSIEQIYAQIEEELRNQYNLGYTPDRAANVPAGYHKIHLTTKQKDLLVQARDGYYAE